MLTVRIKEFFSLFQILPNISRKYNVATVKCEVHNEIGSSADTKTLEVACKDSSNFLPIFLSLSQENVEKCFWIETENYSFVDNLLKIFFYKLLLQTRLDVKYLIACFLL
jgi:hypothetical protein